ncbi:MAG: DNA-binding response regulator [Sphingobacteriales bacterium]|jgi:DNA-binding NarL/FixJ family response regulator|nr:MAG: DNA-binding response regulator [Sphingobacteriales bacterium]
MIDVGIIVANQVQSTFYETYLKSTKRFRISFSVDTLSSLTTAIIVYGEPEVLIIQSLQEIGSIEEFSVILKSRQTLKSLLILEKPEDLDLAYVTRLGIHGYLQKSGNIQELTDAMEKLVAEGGYISPRIATHLINNLQKRPEDRYNELLTNREREIMKFICEGLTYKEIAERMFITPFTVNQHLKKIYLKLKVKSKGELISKMLSVK